MVTNECFSASKNLGCAHKHYLLLCVLNTCGFSVHTHVFIRTINLTCMKNTPGTAGGPGGRDQTLAVKRRKTPENQFFFVKN